MLFSSRLLRKRIKRSSHCATSGRRFEGSASKAWESRDEKEWDQSLSSKSKESILKRKCEIWNLQIWNCKEQITNSVASCPCRLLRILFCLTSSCHFQSDPHHGMEGGPGIEEDNALCSAGSFHYEACRMILSLVTPSDKWQWTFVIPEVWIFLKNIFKSQDIQLRLIDQER